jgi:hypothetical protein
MEMVDNAVGDDGVTTRVGGSAPAAEPAIVPKTLITIAQNMSFLSFFMVFRSPSNS